MLWLLWLKYLMLAKLIDPPVPFLYGDPKEVYLALTKDGTNWGRETAFVAWLVKLFGSIKARDIWMAVQTSVAAPWD